MHDVGGSTVAVIHVETRNTRRATAAHEITDRGLRVVDEAVDGRDVFFVLLVVLVLHPKEELALRRLELEEIDTTGRTLGDSDEFSFIREDYKILVAQTKDESSRTAIVLLFYLLGLGRSALLPVKVHQLVIAL